MYFLQWLCLIFIWTFGFGVQSDVMQHTNWKLFDNESCGTTNSDRIIGGKNASLGAYPWIAQIGYTIDSKPKLNYRCGGTLINQIYVVTAAHCVSELPETFIVGGIRLGEHNTNTDPDCENGYCAEPVQDFKPERISVHHDYNKKPFKNDIAIIRLDKPVVFNEYVRPICMIRDELLTKDFVGKMAEVAGWGIYDINNPKPSVSLLTITLPIVDLEKCKKAFKAYADVGQGQMCVGGKVGQDSCGGDSGGPLMKVEALEGPPRYYLIGVVSFGAKHCGASATPAVYTQISEYLTWILDNMQP